MTSEKTGTAALAMKASGYGPAHPARTSSTRVLLCPANMRFKLDDGSWSPTLHRT